MHLNLKNKEIICKIVYYGPGLSGKTTNVKKLYEMADSSRRGSLTELATEGERTLFFDYFPLEVSTVSKFKLKFNIYTTPGQVIYERTRSVILKGVDGIVFVADSQKARHLANLSSFEEMEGTLNDLGLFIGFEGKKAVPLVIQYNKRDLPNVLPVEVLRRELNKHNVPDVEAIALKGVGVKETFTTIVKLVTQKIKKSF